MKLHSLLQLGKSQLSHDENRSIHDQEVSLGPLKYVPRDGGLFSNVNFLIGDIYLGRRVYPLYSAEEIRFTPQHFAYFDPTIENSWFQFFEPISYYPGDKTHFDTDRVAEFVQAEHYFSPPEFRIPDFTLKLYHREDFPFWRRAVRAVAASKLKIARSLRPKVQRMLQRMKGHKIGVHVRHPSHYVEQGRVFFADYFKRIDEVIDGRRSASIFLATDNDLALATFRQRYGDRVFYYQDFIRESVDDVLDWSFSLINGNPDIMGFIENKGYQSHCKIAAQGGGADGIRSGKEAAIDVFTLAGCDEFVCSASNFTLACSYLNPDLRLHMISKGATNSSVARDPSPISFREIGQYLVDRMHLSKK